MSTSTRRSFLAAATAAAPAIWAQSKSGSRLPVIGSGDYQYEVIHDWGEVPAGIAYGNTHGVCEDAQGNIYIHHTVNKTSESRDAMVVFDARGKFVRSWGPDFKGGAHGLHIRKEGSAEYLYLCDTQRGLMVKTTLAGEEVMKIAYPTESKAYAPSEDGKPVKFSPTNIAIAPNGDLYIADGYGSSYINQYDAKGKYIRTFGGKGKEAGKLDCPHGLTIDARGAQPQLLVADRANNRLQYFTLAGEHVKFVEGVNLPCHFGERKGVMVVPDLASRVTLIDRENRVIEHLGEDKESDSRKLRTKARTEFLPGKFVCPHSACFDHEGNIFVVEWVEVGRVTKLRKV
jgi:sugar lactone lactonase YvrE